MKDNEERYKERREKIKEMKKDRWNKERERESEYLEKAQNWLLLKI